MSLGSLHYAGLADHSYDRDGRMSDLSRSREVFEINGERFKVLEFVDNPRNGYQGTIYQHVDSGEIIVGHRGTEFERERWNDLIKTDGLMVAGRVNIQADDAIALTRRAHELAGSPEMVEAYGRAPEVTVTGHSLGGTLAQITAHHYDLRGETFNAYGAVSLNLRIPEGGSRVVNHVMAVDTVSAGSPHYGEVRVYAQQQEVDMLRGMGYANNDSHLFDIRNKLGAGIRGFGSHDMHLFLDRDGDGLLDRSVLSDPAMRERAETYAPMIGKYREDMEDIRRGITMTLRGPGGLIVDGIDRLRGTVQAGERGAREVRDAAVQEAASRPVQGASMDANRGHVSLMLDAARRGDVGALEQAQGGLWASAYGYAWQQRVEELKQVLPERGEILGGVDPTQRDPLEMPGR